MGRFGNQASGTTLVAEVSGVVTAIEAEPGQVVSAGTPVVRIAQDGARDVVFAVPEDRAALIRASFIEGIIDHRKLFQELDQRVVKPVVDDETEVVVAGEPQLYGWVYQYAGEIYWILAATAVLAWILLYLYFRDWKGALRPTISGLIAAVWGLGFIHLIGFSLDPLTLVIPFFITARAVSHSAQMHERYYEEYKKSGWNQEQAIIQSFAALFVPTLSGILTDALGVLAILLVPIVLLQKLALTASFWIGAIVVSELFLNPIVYYYLKPPDKAKVLAREEGGFKRVIEWWTDLMLAHRWTVLFVWLGCTALAGTQLQHLTDRLELDDHARHWVSYRASGAGHPDG